MPSTLPLFRLPFLALKVVIDQLHLNHLIMLIFCSQKSMRICKTLRRKSTKMHIEIDYTSEAKITLIGTLEDLSPWPAGWLRIAQCSQINIKKIAQLSDLLQKRVNVNGFSAPMSYEINEQEEVELSLFFNEKFDGFKTLAECFTRFFNFPISEIFVSTEEYPDQIRRTIDWIVSRQESIPICFIEDDRIDDDQIRDVLNVSNHVKELLIKVRPTDSFSHQFIFNNEFIKIYNAFWFNLQNLFNVDCRFILLYGTKLTSQEMNQYLKYWMNGSFSKVKFVDIDMEEIDLQSLLEDLNAVEIPEGERRLYKNDSMEYVVTYGFDIFRNDGTAATILHEGEDTVSERFYLLVW